MVFFESLATSLDAGGGSTWEMWLKESHFVKYPLMEVSFLYHE